MKPLALAVVLASVYFAACGGDAPPTKMDAAGGSGSGSGSGAFGAACTVVTDTGSTQCASGVCTDSFNMTTPLCSQKCTMLMMTDPSCPTGSMGQKCNAKGYCRP
ncbi:MAG TPA: hypothetical protein VFQ65_33915 [Kofleriaceae bacterium]|nr:hypothetical protein [Kofleriaceae bacterium]